MSLIFFQDHDLQNLLLKYARAVLEADIRQSAMPQPPVVAHQILALRPGVFVTLTTQKGLRGCIGQIIGTSDPLTAIRQLCHSSACEDPRFPMVQSQELPEITIEISLLTPPLPIVSWKEIQLGTHGIILSSRGRSAVFLPQVAEEQGWDLPQTLTALARKAGLDPAAWQDISCHFEVFTATHFKES